MPGMSVIQKNGSRLPKNRTYYFYPLKINIEKLQDASCVVGMTIGIN